MPGCAILLVEDDLLIAFALGEALTGLGHRVTRRVTTGAAALGAAAQERPDVALIDLGLDGSMDGAATALALRREHDVPSVILSGVPRAEAERRCIDAAPLACLSKPVLIQELHRILQTVTPAGS